MSDTFRIGYLDENIDQFKLYSRKLRKYGFDVIGYDFKKGMSKEELMDQVFNSDIDLLMIDYKLKESNLVAFNGEEVEKFIYENRPQFPYIIFTNKVEQAEPFVEDWKIIFDKDEIFPEDVEDGKKAEKFVTILKKSIEQYKNHINAKKESISGLLQKGLSEGLNSVEKSRLLDLQEDLISLDKTKKREIPKQLVDLKKLDDLSKSRKEAEAFLKSLISKSENEG